MMRDEASDCLEEALELYVRQKDKQKANMWCAHRLSCLIIRQGYAVKLDDGAHPLQAAVRGPSRVAEHPSQLQP